MTGTENMNRLADLRRSREMSIAELAVLCDVGHRTVERWERGETGIPDDQKRLLCQHFEVSADHLLGWDRQPETGKAAA
jgi:transcriptional regulator with XRE-family HTH domain